MRFIYYVISTNNQVKRRLPDMTLCVIRST